MGDVESRKGGGDRYDRPTQPATRRNHEVDLSSGDQGPPTREDGGLPSRYIGRFTVLHPIGQGGMGIVYVALDEQLDRKVAIKLLHSTQEPADDLHARMIREARAMARLSHPNVVQVHDVGQIDGRIFVAMEYVQGQTLGQWLRSSPRSSREILSVFHQAGQGLAAAHEAGIVHRDFKPENVIVGQDGRVKVLDFGLALGKTLALDGGSSTRAERDPSGATQGPRPLATLTKTGAIMGTPVYMSPEQFLDREIDARTDQFSFCVALYEALFGERPFASDSFEILLGNVVSGRMREPRPGADVPKHLPRLLGRGLAVDPADRFASMDALLVGLEDFQSRVDALNTRMLRLETALGSLLVFAFWALDWLVMPEYVWATLGIRLGICVYAMFGYVLCRFWPRRAERHIDVLSFSINLVAGWGLVGLAWMEGGLESHYYAGLNLLVLCLGIMFLWSIRRALALNGLIYVFYMSPLVLDALPAGDPNIIVANQFFLISTIILTIAAQHQRHALEHRQFLAEQERRLLRAEVDAMGSHSAA